MLIKVKHVSVFIDGATQFATAYDSAGKPMGTLQRRRIYEPGPFNWRVYLTDGTLVGSSVTARGALTQLVFWGSKP